MQKVKVCTCYNYSLHLFAYSINLAFSCSKVANLEKQLTIKSGVNLFDYNRFLANTID